MRHITAVILLVMTELVICALAIAPVDASYECDRDLDPAPLALGRYDAVFVGRVVGVRLRDANAEPELYLEGEPELAAEFAVRRIYKGQIGGHITLTARPRALKFEVGRIYLVWAVRDEDGADLVTNACGRSSLQGDLQFDSDVRLLEDPSQTPTTPCAALDDDSRKAVLAYVDAAYPLSAGLRASDSRIEWADQKLSERRESASGCLAWIYREGLRGTGLWSHRSSPPGNGQWALAVLSRVDSHAAIPFWYECRKRLLAYPWDRVEVDLELLALDDHAAIGWVMGFLQNPPPLQTFEARFAGVARIGIQELARLDYRPASALVRQFRGRGYVPDSILDVYDAQFDRDVGGLERLARAPDTAIAALNALARIDATSSLQRIARDRSHPFRSEAKSFLKRRRTTTGRSSRS